jgi:UDP-N-acetylmuramate dehydrogenase
MSEIPLPPVRGQVLRGESLAPLTWFRVGGPADALFLPADEDDLARFLMQLPTEIPVTVLGVGSNVIIRDGGLAGVVVRLAGRQFGQIEVDARDGLVTAGAGALDAMVAKAAAKAGVAGLEFLAGVPGTIGGALTMNAGCYGSELSDVFVCAYGVTRTGDKRAFGGVDMGFGYRRNGVETQVIWTGVKLRGTPSTPDAVSARMAEITAQREAAQPIREKTGGSTFKNPVLPNGEKLSAWKLVDEAGMRGARRGGAQVSEKHANFLINTGEASAADIEGLGEDVRAAVRAKLGVELEWEIKRLGRTLKPDN